MLRHEIQFLYCRRTQQCNLSRPTSAAKSSQRQTDWPLAAIRGRRSCKTITDIFYSGRNSQVSASIRSTYLPCCSVRVQILLCLDHSAQDLSQAYYYH